jgi:N-acyl-D-amino-acid deacylase
MFRIASISKMLTSAAIMHLRDQGQLDLDQKVVDLLTNFAPGASADPHVRDITIRHLLQHSAGWDSATVGDPAFQSNKITQALAVGSPANSSDLTRYMLNQPLQFAPGSRYAYLNAGYTILGRVIEKISGQSYESYVREQVLAGFGIHAMSIGRSRASERGQLEVEYYPQSNEAPLDADIPGDGKVPAPYATYIARFDSAGGWIASAIDLTRMMAVLESSRIPTFLSADSIAQMLAPPPWPSGGGGPGTWYGFGVDIGPTNATYKHGGALSGTTSMVIHEPQGYTIAILMNSYDTRHPELPLLAQSAMIQALGSGFTGSSSDLYLQYPSPSLPASGQ